MQAGNETLRDFITRLVGDTGAAGIDVNQGLWRVAHQLQSMVDTGEPILLDGLLTMEQRENIRLAAETMFAAGLIIALCANDRAAALDGMANWFATSGSLASVAHLGINLTREPLPIENPDMLAEFVREYGA